MSDSKVEAAESTTNPTMDKPKNESGDAKAAPEDKETSADSDADQGMDADEQGEKRSARRGPRTYENGMLKTSAITQYQHTNRNSKYDPSVLKTSDNPKEIRGQVEFYFSDSNLPTDQFMMKETKGPENNPILLKKIHGFGRMRRFQPYSAIVAALKDSKFLNVTGEEGEEMVSRKVAYDPSTPVSKTEARSVYVKGFGDEEPSSQFDIEAFFAQFGTTNAVRLRRTPEKLFKGSVFVEWSDEEAAQKFLALDPQPKWKGKHLLQIMSKTAYLEIKQKEIQDGTIQPSESWGPTRGRGRGRGRGFYNGNDRGRDRGDRDPDDWKKRREEDRANGFKDDRNRHHRGGRGRRGDRGPRDNDRNRERQEKNEYVYPL
jgi:lupus La protein